MLYFLCKKGACWISKQIISKYSVDQNKQMINIPEYFGVNYELGIRKKR